MNTEEKREKIRELIGKIEDDELLSFIYKLSLIHISEPTRRS